MIRPRRPFAAGVAAAALTLALTGCDTPDALPGGGPAPDDTADALAAALASGDLTGLSFTSGTPAAADADYDDVVEALGDVTPTVSVTDVTENGDAATATLAWTWPLGADAWGYQSTADLTRVGDAWKVVWARTVVEPTLKPGEILDVTPITPTRGVVLGARGQVLVENRPVTRVGIDKTKGTLAQSLAAARRLAQDADLDVAAYVKEVRAAGDEAFVEAITYRQRDVPEPVQLLLDGSGPAVGIADQAPLAPTREFAAPLLGSVGEVTAEMVKDDPDAYQPGDVAGLSGLQERYDDQLRGSAGYVVDAVASKTKERQLVRVAPTSGTPLKLTLDPGLETAAERLLADIGPASALVAIRPSTGAILAAANGPGNGGYNIATYGQAAPGSTFKSVSSLALLRAGLTPDSTVPCTSSITVDGKVFTNYSDYPSSAIGSIPLRTAVANSCNTAFISQAPKVKGTALYDAAASLGLGIDHDLGFPAYFGSVEPPTTSTERAADMIGQGTILASPMVMATVIASIQHGALVVPHLVDGVSFTAPDGAKPLSSAETRALRSMLRGVVTDGSGRALLDVPGPPVIAKTGTAEFERDGKTLTHAWMIGAQGDLAVAVYVDEGASGSGTAGPILEGFLRAARG